MARRPLLSGHAAGRWSTAGGAAGKQQTTISPGSGGWKPRSRRWQSWCLLRACFLDHRQVSSPGVLSGRAVRNLSGALLLGH